VLISLSLFRPAWTYFPCRAAPKLGN